VTPELKSVIDKCNAIKPVSPYLFKTRKGEPYLKPDKTTEGFTSIWQSEQNKMPEDKQLAERSIRNWVGDHDDLQTASERLGHASTTTTKKFYRSNVTNVTPLVSNKTSENS
jgi:integrase